MALRVRGGKEADGSFVRSVFVDNDPVLEIVIDKVDLNTGFPAIGTRAEGSLVWAVKKNVPLREHLELAETLFEGYQRRLYPTAIDLLMDGVHHSRTTVINLFADDISGWVGSRRMSPSSSPSLLLLAAGDLAVEWMFVKNLPVRCSVALSLIVAEPLARFFRELHIDGRVQSQGEISRSYSQTMERLLLMHSTQSRTPRGCCENS